MFSALGKMLPPGLQIRVLFTQAITTHCQDGDSHGPFQVSGHLHLGDVEIVEPGG